MHSERIDPIRRPVGRVWYVFPYAGGPGLGRFTRPYDLAREWLRDGIATTIFASQHHHVLYDPAAPWIFPERRPAARLTADRCAIREN